MSIENFINELCTQMVANTEAVVALTAAIEANGTPAAPALSENTAGNAQGGSTGTVGPAAAGATAVLSDLNGMPYDVRIHTAALGDDGTPNKTTKGVWTKKRGVSKEEIKRVEKELMAGASGQAAIPSTASDLKTNGVAIPPTNGVAPPPANAAPELLIPAIASAPTPIEIQLLVKSFSDIHGALATSGKLSLWNMQSIDQLPAAMYAQFSDFMITAHNNV